MEGSNSGKHFLFVSTLLLMAAWGFAGVNFNGDCINDASPDSRCVYLPLDVGQTIGLYVKDMDNGSASLNYRLPNEDVYIYAPNAGSDTIVFTVGSDVVANGQMFTSDNNGYVVTGVVGHWPISNAPLGVSRDGSMQDVNVIYVYNYYVPEFQFCEDADCKQVITDISAIQLNVGDTLPIYVQTVIPQGPSKGKLDSLAQELQFFLSTKHESLKFLTPTKTPMGKATIGGTSYFVGQLSNSRSSFLITSDKAISDVKFTLESSAYESTPGDVIFRAKENFPANLQILNGAGYSTKNLYVLVPDDKDWLYNNMMLSTDGGATGGKMKNAAGMCGWYQMSWDEAPDEVLIYPQNHPELIIGQNGLWGNEAVPTPLPLKDIMEALGTDQLYFIPDDSQWDEGTEDQMGLFLTDPGVDGVCKFQLAGIVWDTDELLNKFFSTVPNGQSPLGWPVDQCTGVRKGVVQTNLGPDNKPRLNSSSNGVNCFGDESGFSTLFNYVENKNEAACYDISFSQAEDGKWIFDSDELVVNGYKGGFYPREDLTSNYIVSELSPQPCPNCRRKSAAEGPVPLVYNGVFDHYCNGPAYDGGVDCEGKFYYGDDPAVWDWSAPRWESDRNRHFCFESHATFTYREDQEFTLLGTDDSWVFVNKKLALDNGGLHLTAPGHVVLKNLNNKYGSDFLVPGNDYSLEIFSCNRTALQSNLTIRTNILVKQTSGLSTTVKDNDVYGISYGICYDQSGDGSCASVALGQAGGGDGTIHACGAEIAAFGNLKYRITTRAGVEVATLESGKAGWQYGGIDLSNQFSPKVNTEKINGLAPGSYRLVIDFCDANGACNEKARTYINFRIKGNLDVMTQTSTYTVNAGDEKSPHYASGSKWIFVDKGLAGSRVPVYVSAFADGGVDLLGAVGSRYSLILDERLVAYTTKNGGMQVTWPRTINETGVDTIWVTAPLDALTTSPTEFSVSLKSSARIKFYATSEEIPSSSSEEEVSSASTQSSSSMKQSSSSVKQSSSSTNSQGGECTLTDMGDGRIIQKCGNQETVLYKALCGTKPYDPDGDYFCYGVKLYEKCDDEAYDVNTQECVGGTVKDLGSSSSGKEGPEAIKAATLVSWSVQTNGRTLHIFEARVGSLYALIDMQGRVLSSGVVNSNNFAIPVGLGGQYMLKIGNQTQVVRVW